MKYVKYCRENKVEVFIKVKALWTMELSGV